MKFSPQGRLPPVSVAGVRNTLQRMNPRKAMGADCWHFSELLALPAVFLRGLATFFNLVEQEGTWPNPLRVVLIALIPKERRH